MEWIDGCRKYVLSSSEIFHVPNQYLRLINRYTLVIYLLRVYHWKNNKHCLTDSLYLSISMGYQKSRCNSEITRSSPLRNY